MLSCNLPPHCSRSRPYTLKQALTAHLLRAFSLHALATVLSRKPIFDPFLQTSVLGLDTLGGVADTGCIHNLVCSCHGLREMHSSSSPGWWASSWTSASFVSFGPKLPPSGPKLAVLALHPVCPKS